MQNDVDDKLLNHVAKFGKLRWLDLSYLHQITDAGLMGFGNQLESLTLCMNDQLTDQGLANVAGRLKRLTIDKCHITDNGIHAVGQTLQHLYIDPLMPNSISTQVWNGLHNLKNAVFKHSNKLNITARDMARMRNLTRLEFFQCRSLIINDEV